MELIFKINTGIIKTGKNLQSRFNYEDKQNLEILEKNSASLFDSLLFGKVKNCFGGLNSLDISDRVNFNILRKKGISKVTYIKKIRGCFITYTFEVV